jgi:cellulose 1,4-beta-cellobiosidase
VKRATASGGSYTTIAGGVTSTGYTDTNVVNGTTYYYVVSAVNANGESANSSEVSATPQAPQAPAAPTNLTATGAKRKISLAWNASTGAASYNVKSSGISGGPYTTIATGVTTTSYANTGLKSGTTYYYVVSAVNAAGESPNSNEASATAK